MHRLTTMPMTSPTRLCDASEAGAKGDFKVAVARAEATHKIATEKCEALTGPAQEDCKDARGCRPGQRQASC